MSDDTRAMTMSAGYYADAIPAVWRRPEREVPVTSAVLADLMDGRLSVSLKATLEGSAVYERVAPADPDRAAFGADPLEVLVAEAASIERLALSLEVRRRLRKLSPMDAMVLRLRYGIGGRAHTQEETARVMGRSRRTIYAAEKRALAQLAAAGSVARRAAPGSVAA